MIFNHRDVTEIDDEELINLLGNQEENLWIDFKQKQYHRENTTAEERRHEICKDVTAMANAEGGYIVIGVQEKGRIAQSFFDIPDVEREAESLYDVCHQYIVPRIANLEIVPRDLQYQDQQYNLIIVHIPFSEIRPHGFNSNGTLNFVKRYGDVTKEFQMEEFIPELIARHHLPSMNDFGEQLDRIENQITNILDEIGGNA